MLKVLILSTILAATPVLAADNLGASVPTIIAGTDAVAPDYPVTVTVIDNSDNSTEVEEHSWIEDTLDQVDRVSEILTAKLKEFKDWSFPPDGEVSVNEDIPDEKLEPETAAKQ